MPIAKKTGTTIVGVVFNVCAQDISFAFLNFVDKIHVQGGVCLGADTRATEGPIVADKNCEKIHYIAPNIYCCGAGTSADTENTTGNYYLITRSTTYTFFFFSYTHNHL